MDDVETRVDHRFLAERAGTTVALLDESDRAVVELELGVPEGPRAAGRFETSRVDLTGPADPRLPQETYRARFADGVDTWLFLVPSAGDDDTTTYTLTVSVEAR